MKFFLLRWQKTKTLLKECFIIIPYYNPIAVPSHVTYCGWLKIWVKKWEPGTKDSDIHMWNKVVDIAEVSLIPRLDILTISEEWAEDLKL